MKNNKISFISRDKESMGKKRYDILYVSTLDRLTWLTREPKNLADL